jgi:hypothetical protein
MDNFNQIIKCDVIKNRIIENKGEKEVIIHTNGSEKKHITCLLAITANRIKLKPYLIFKGVEDGFIEKKLSCIRVVKNKEILVSCQKNAWFTSDIYLNWLEEIFYNYELFIVKITVIL